MIKILRHMKRKQWVLFAASTAFILLQTFLDLSIPDYMSAITEMVQTGTATTSGLVMNGCYMLLCAGGATIAAIASGYTSAKMAASLSQDIRSEIFHKVQTFSKEEMDRFSTASLITRSTNDVVQLQNFCARGLRMLVRVPIIVSLALYKMSVRYWQWSAATALTVVLIMIVIALLIKYAHPRFRRMQILTDDVNRSMRENMTGMRVIRAYNAKDYQMADFERANTNLMSNERKARTLLQLMPSTNQFAANALTVAIYCIGAYLVAVASSGTEQIAIFTDMVVFSTYATKMLQGISSLELIFNMLPRAATSSERILEILNTDPKIQSGTVTERKGPASIEFKNVSFKYPGTSEMAIEDISFRIEEGQTVGIIGSTASGKSTLMNLIPRLYDVTEGEVLVGGLNVKEYDCGELRRQMSYVPQTAVLFTGTVESNVSYGGNPPKGGASADAEGENAAHKERVRHAIEVSQSEEFVSRMPGQEEAPVFRGGTNVSGGQKQRLSIARAIYRHPDIYLFDDAFSALDYKTDRLLRAGLKKESSGATVLIVSSRIATIKDADKILVMDEGRIVGEGTHKELLESCRVYQEIAYTQLTPEELAKGA